MKKSLKVALLGSSLLLLGGGISFGLIHGTNMVPTYAEGEVEEPEPVEEEPVVAEATVLIEKTAHGSISVDKLEGQVGDIITITAKHDLLYKVEWVKVNDIQLIESEHTSGEFSFALVAGENKITASFIVDEELCGDLTNIVSQASEKDWSHLFTVENVIVIVKWLLDGGILIALIRYYVKDKKLEKKLEENVQKTMNKLVPDTTKQTVVKTVQEVIKPIFAQTQSDMIEIKQAMSVFSKCFALAQENTPESRRAILDELTSLKFGDATTVETIKKYIDELIAEHEETLKSALDAINKIGESNKEILEEGTEEVVEEAPEEAVDNGTSI